MSCTRPQHESTSAPVTSRSPSPSSTSLLLLLLFIPSIIIPRVLLQLTLHYPSTRQPPLKIPPSQPPSSSKALERHELVLKDALMVDEERGQIALRPVLNRLKRLYLDTLHILKLAYLEASF